MGEQQKNDVRDLVEEALGMARGLAKKIAEDGGEPGARLAKAGIAAVDSLDRLKDARDDARKERDALVAAQASVMGRAGDVAAAAVKQVGGDAPSGLGDRQRDARSAVSAAMFADANADVLARKGSTLADLAAEASKACSAFASTVAGEEALSTGVGASLDTKLTLEDAQQDYALETELAAKSSADLLTIFRYVRELSDEEKAARMRRVSLKIATARLAAKASPRPTPAELSDRAAASMIVSAIGDEHRAMIATALDSAKALVELLRTDAFRMLAGFDARSASAELMRSLRENPARLVAVTAPWAISPTFPAQLLSPGRP